MSGRTFLPISCVKQSSCRRRVWDRVPLLRFGENQLEDGRANHEQDVTLRECRTDGFGRDEIHAAQVQRMAHRDVEFAGVALEHWRTEQFRHARGFVLRIRQRNRVAQHEHRLARARERLGDLLQAPGIRARAPVGVGRRRDVHLRFGVQDVHRQTGTRALRWLGGDLEGAPQARGIVRVLHLCRPLGDGSGHIDHWT